jgi:uncharacterized radical SAM superfamily Fe-S cluster-containing enzyme
MNEYLTTTVSLCRTCGRRLPAKVCAEDGGVWMHKECPEHGPQSVRVWSDVASYLALGRYHRAGSMPMEFATAMDRGCPDSCGLCPEHEQHVCLPIIEITDHCDLACPVCLVNNRGRFHLTRGQVAGILDRLIAAEGRLDIVNLSGGEPTMNPDFRGIVEECLARKEILYVSVSTNGLRLARDRELLEFLAARGVVVSLQFDGSDDEVYRALRGRALADEKGRLLDAATELSAPMSLTMTVVRGVNESRVEEAVRLLFERDNLRSVMFQPVAYTGGASALARPAETLTIPDVIRALDGAAGGQVAADDFSPLPCSHPACFALAFYLRTDDGRHLPIKRFVQIDRYLDMVQNRAIFGTDAESFEAARDAVYDLWSGPAALVPDSEKALSAARRLLDSAACARRGACSPAATVAAAKSIKSIFIHHFMDRDTFDLARARKCCNVYPLADGRMMPACVYNCLRRPS